MVKVDKRIIVSASVTLLVVGVGISFALNTATEDTKKTLVEHTASVKPNNQPGSIQQNTVPDSAPQMQQVPQQQLESTPQPQATPEPRNVFTPNSNAWYVFNRRKEVGKGMPMPSIETVETNYCVNLNQESPSAYSDTPSQYSIACNIRYVGHVAFVEEVTSTGIWVSEMNSYGQVSKSDTTETGGWGVVDWKFITFADAQNAQHYKYIN